MLTCNMITFQELRPGVVDTAVIKTSQNLL